MVRFMEGPGKIEGDNPFFGELYCSQLERALLENLQVSRQLGPQSKTLTLPEIEDRLEKVILVIGEAGLNELRDRARKITAALHMEKEFGKLNKVISALLTSHPSKILTSPLEVARTFGSPYDPVRLPLFEKLFIELKQKEFKDYSEQNISNQSFRNFAFFEAYFSNYIEGTEFELEDARRIIDTGTPMPSRDEDSHDVLGTYNLVSNRQEMSIAPTTADQMLEILLYRHQELMGSRISKKPGQFKDKNTRAGDTFFVDQTLVKGTLIKGFDFYQALTHPFARAVYIMFLISEVHPFLDGNGRIARVMMNAELVYRGQTKIIIPTVYRDDYIGVLRKLSRQQDPTAYIRMLQRAQDFSATVKGDNIDVMEKHLKACNAFKEHDQAKLKY